MRVALLRRHASRGRRQGDQERGRLRPGEAVRGLVRHARRDRRAVACGCTRCAPRPPPPTGAWRRRRPARGGARGARPVARSSSTALDVRWRGGRGDGARALRAERRRARRPRRPSGCSAGRASTPSVMRRRRRRLGRRSAPRSAGDLVVRVSAPRRRGCGDLLRADRRSWAPRWSGRAALGVSWLGVPAGRRGADAVAGCAEPPAVLRGARRGRGRPPRARSWGMDEIDPGAVDADARVKERFDPAACEPWRSWEASVAMTTTPRAAARPDRRLRALRLLPAHLPDLRALGRGDGLAARAHRA